MNQLADSLYTTANTIAQAAWALVLGELSGRDDVVFGATRAGRRLPVSGIRKMIGLLVTVVPLRVRWQESVKVRDFLGSIREQWLNFRDHEYVPNSVHREHLRFSDTDTLIDTSVTFEGMGLNQTMKEPDGSPMPSTAELATERAVAVHAYGGDQIEIHVVVHPDHGDASTARILIEHLKATMSALVEHQQGTIEEVLQASVPVRELDVIRDANQTTSEFDNDLLVHELVEQIAAHHPDRTAVESRDMSLTYEALNQRANALARTLAKLGLSPGESVAVMWSRDADLAVVLLAVFKSGATFVPLDARQPKRRLASMLESVQPEYIVVQEPLAQHLPTTDTTTVVLESCDESLAIQTADDLGIRVAPEDIAYTIYTSGSTGLPKGVDVPHRSLANLIKTKLAEPGLSADDCLLAATTVSFDPAMLQLTLPLVAGARLVIADEEAVFGGESLAQFLSDFNATFLMTSPVIIDTLRQCDWPGKSDLRVSYGGEPLAEGLAEWILPRVESLWNCYGPTEATIHCVQTKIEKPADTRYIGRPLANTNAFVLDSRGEQTSIGQVGELYVGGTCLAKGYRKAEHLTSERFVEHPLAQGPDARLYRTGDLARWTTDGQLEYLGRADDQVKLQGVRVELSEVEHALEEHHSVSRAVVVATGNNGRAELTGFVVPQDTSTSAAQDSLRAELRQHLFETLPTAMHPRHLAVVATIPSTLQGKVDRSALVRDFHAETASDSNDAPSVSDEHTPRSELEEKLVRIWQSILDRPDVNVDDDFFELGGNSLLALRMFNMLEDEVSVRVSVANLVHHRTIRSIASLVESDGAVVRQSLVVELQPEGNRPPVFCAHGIGGEVVQLTALAKHLPREQPLFGFQAAGRDTKEKPFSSIEKMAARYIE
ncbi:MAG: amino acid adenylation domain-containing protein, partial [Pirellulales bacterium]|nr:amino acid adenylation domain-containing protein [Pirellulales bacterium]